MRQDAGGPGLAARMSVRPSRPACRGRAPPPLRVRGLSGAWRRRVARGHRDTRDARRRARPAVSPSPRAGRGAGAHVAPCGRRWRRLPIPPRRRAAPRLRHRAWRGRVARPPFRLASDAAAHRGAAERGVERDQADANDEREACAFRLSSHDGMSRHARLGFRRCREAPVTVTARHGRRVRVSTNNGMASTPAPWAPPRRGAARRGSRSHPRVTQWGTSPRRAPCPCPRGRARRGDGHRDCRRRERPPDPPRPRPTGMSEGVVGTPRVVERASRHHREGVVATPGTLRGHVSRVATRRRSPPSRAPTRAAGLRRHAERPVAGATANDARSHAIAFVVPRAARHAGRGGARLAGIVEDAQRRHGVRVGGPPPLGPRSAATRRARRRRARHGRPEPRHARPLFRRPQVAEHKWTSDCCL